MEFDFRDLKKELRYKLLVSFVAPRPIALVSTLSSDGVVNAAPMSFFNVFGDEPPILVLGIQSRPDGRLKDTAKNIRDSGEFVVNLVDPTIQEQMVICSLDFPPEEDEVAAAGLTLAPSNVVRPGRIAESPASMECTLYQAIDFPNRSILLGEVQYMHVRDACIDPDTLRVRPENYSPVARLHGDFYVAASDQYELFRPSYEEWRAKNPSA